MTPTPNRAQPAHVARANGRKGKRASPWSRKPHINSAFNEQRKKQWSDEHQ